MKLWHVATLLAVSAPIALAQPITNNLPVYQSGTVTPGHVPIFSTGGVIVDNGASDNGGATGFGMTAPGIDLFVNDNPITSLSGYHQLGFGALATVGGNTGGFITYNAYGGATPQSLYINLNGTNYEVPFTGTGLGNVTGPTSSTVGDITLFNNNSGSLLVDSGVPVTSTLTVPATATSSSANTIVITPTYALHGVTTPQNGLSFRFASPITTDFTGFFTVNSITGLTGGPWLVYYPNGDTFVYSNDINIGQYVTLTYSSAVNGFILSSPQSVTTGFNAGLGTSSQQSIAADNIPPSSHINLNDAAGGNGMQLFYNLDTHSYQSLHIVCCLSQGVFNNTAIVNGVSNSSLSCGHFYYITTEPVSHVTFPLTNGGYMPLYSFWDGSLGYTIATSPDNLTVLDKPGTGVDPERILLGYVFPRTLTGLPNCDVGNNINTNSAYAPMGNAVYSWPFSGRENFGYTYTAQNTNLPVGGFATMVLPFEASTTGGQNDTPNVIANSSITCPASAGGASVLQQFQIAGIAQDGATFGPFAWDQESSTIGPSGGTVFLSSQYASAPSVEYIEFHIQFNVSVAGCSAFTHMTGMFPQ